MEQKTGPNWANQITYSRFFLAPLFLGLYMVWSQQLMVLWIVFLLGEVTDVLDGWVARRFGYQSDLGKVLDPFADVYSRLTIFLGFLMTGHFPLWAFVLLFYRELSMTFFRLVSMMKGRVVGASTGGKLKAWVYFLVSVFLMVRHTFQILAKSTLTQEFWGLFELIAVSLAVAFSLGSFGQYVVAYRKALKK